MPTCRQNRWHDTTADNVAAPPRRKRAVRRNAQLRTGPAGRVPARQCRRPHQQRRRPAAQPGAGGRQPR
ncbi:hypothetical protein G6F40_016011 [Rhizopus arrhizus]|nr:hypothetical protein G6F32_016541 [Rhizopus arrhizus]KAG1080162.1 hypothetical protein G6F40_016011 [Rhizopus arrhizus]KAG1370753.1 hypothetical protein G6F59_018645 [Rhizopus arrhizus]